MNKILFLLLTFLTVSAPVAGIGAENELCISYDQSSKKMRQMWMKNHAGTYEFKNTADLQLAKAALEALYDRLDEFDRGVLSDNSGTEDERYQRFLERLRRCREASGVLKSALAKAK
jgi:hypothetical protein